MPRYTYRKINGQSRRVKITGKGKSAKVKVLDKRTMSVPMIGRTNKRVVKERHAKRPGWRTPKGGGKSYFENRKNRSDKGKWL